MSAARARAARSWEAYLEPTSHGTRSRRAVRRLRDDGVALDSRGTLPAIRLPSGQIRYRAEQLDVWLEQRATPNREALTADGAVRQQTLPSSALAAVTTEE